MSCPDINRLIDLSAAELRDSELETHLEYCPSCGAEFRLIREIPVALRPDIDVPEALILRVMADISGAGPSRETDSVPVLQVFGAGVLGTITALITLGATGSASTGNLFTLLGFSLAVGLASAVAHGRRGFTRHRSRS